MLGLEGFNFTLSGPTFPMRHLCFLLLFLVTSCATTRSVSQSALPVDFFTGPSGKNYLLMSDSRLVTRNALGQTVNEFYDSSLGLPTTIDVTNPFSILLYYQDFGRLIILDRTLSELARIDLFSTEGLQQPGALARANDNQIWVYDSWDYKLKLLDTQGKVVRATNNLRLELKVTEDPDEIYVDRGTVALHFKQKNRLAVLTNYARFERWVELPPTKNISWNTPYLSGYDDRNSWRWTAGAERTQTWALPQVPELGELRRRPRLDGYLLLTPTGATELISVKQ